MTGGANDSPSGDRGVGTVADPGAGGAARATGAFAARLVADVHAAQEPSPSDAADPSSDEDGAGVGAVTERRVRHTISRLVAARRPR